MMLVNYLQQQAQLPNLQDRKAYMKYVVKGAQVPENNFMIEERLSTEDRKRIRSYLNVTNVKLFNDQDQEKKTERIDSFQLNLGKEPHLKSKIQAELQHTRSLMGGRYKVHNESLLVRFIRFLLLKLPQGNLQFDLTKGRVVQKRYKKLQVSVKDPYLRYENHGCWLKDKQRLDRLLLRLRYFLRYAQEGKFEMLMGDIRSTYETAPEAQ